MSQTARKRPRSPARDKRKVERTTLVGMRFLNEGFQDKLRRSFNMTDKNKGVIRDAIGIAFLQLIPNHENLTHAEMAAIISDIAAGRYTLDTAIEVRQRAKVADLQAAKQSTVSKLRNLREDLKERATS